MKYWLCITFLFQLSTLASCLDTVLVVNGGSFIGYHTALTISKRKEAHVIIVDDFKGSNSNRQRQRAYRLSEKLNVNIYQGNVCDNYFLMELFNQYNFKTVIYSPLGSDQDVNRLLEMSTECITNILEMIKKDKKKASFIFLSPRDEYSQSSASLSTVSPSSIELAMELSAEEMVSTYCQLCDIPIIILRLLNVYGPWSDPGNIIHDIAQQVYYDMDLQLPIESSNIRDFTYIDDVIEAIQLSLDHTPKDCIEVYNIGSGKGVSVRTVVNFLTAFFKKLDKFDGDSLNDDTSVSFSELALSMESLKYSPKVTIEEGILSYATWFQENINVLNTPSTFTASTNILDGASKNHIKYKSQIYLDRVWDLRQEYETYAEERGYAVSKLYKDKKFIKRSGFNFNGGNNQKTKDLSELLYRCQVFDECMGYDSNGIIKGVLDPESSWSRTHGDVYIADVDVCQAGVHKCYGNATCISTGLGQFKCACPLGWKLYNDHDCIELYKPGHKTVAETIEEITDKIDGLDWNEFAKNSDFHPFKGKTLRNEYLAYFPEAKGNIQLLTEACMKSYHCMGFTSDGVLMSNVDVRKWVGDSSVTLYARDVNYCSVDEVLCKQGQTCRRVSPGKWACA